MLYSLISYYSFQAALKKYGVPDLDVFQTVDLWEKKDIAQVTNTIFALGREVSDTFCLLDRNKKWNLNFLRPTDIQNGQDHG